MRGRNQVPPEKSELTPGVGWTEQDTNIAKNHAGFGEMIMSVVKPQDKGAVSRSLIDNGVKPLAQASMMGSMVEEARGTQPKEVVSYDADGNRDDPYVREGGSIQYRNVDDSIHFEDESDDFEL